VRLLLARHGQSVWNQVRKFQGANDVGLSDLGRVQSEALGRALRAGYRVAAAYVSPMCRALDTAEIALAGTGIPLVPIPELRELSLGEWEGCTVDEVRARDGNPYRAWVRSPLDCPPPGGEPLPDVCGRVLKAIGQIRASHRNGDDVLVVAHGGVISVYLCHLLGVSFNSLWRMRIDNCSLTIVRPPRLVSVNDTAHLPSAPNATWFDVSGTGGDPAGAPDAGGGGRGRRDPFPPRDVGPHAPGWSPAAEEQRTRAAWSSRPLPPPPASGAPAETPPDAERAP
jgi:broad specificity phosphatase PhoE